MAMKHDERELSERKASSLSGDTLTSLSRTSKGSGKSGKDKKEKFLPGKRRFSLRGLLVDLALLLVLCGLGVGIWFGYRAVKNIYAPEWETRQISFVVEITDLGLEETNALRNTLSGSPLWYSSAADGDMLGQISQLDSVPYTTEEGEGVLALYLTVTAEAKYREGQGYYVGSTRLLAGENGVFRTEGLITEGAIVSLQDLTEVNS